MGSTAADSNGSMTELSHLPRTELVFHLPTHQQTYSHRTTVTSVFRLEDLPESDAQVFKAPAPTADSPLPSLHAVTTKSTIFHPQGGGQPSDVGHFSADGQVFQVLAARTSPTNPQIVLHFGTLTSPQSSLLPGQNITQHVDADKRTLFSRLHTAGHVLGAATRRLLEHRIENFDELKASHFPDSAACEFSGLIDGKLKPEIQTAVDELIARDAEVRIAWWRKRDFSDRGLDRLLPEEAVWNDIAVLVDEHGVETGLEESSPRDQQTRIRVVEIVGTEVYPCGGTHVPTTKACGKVGVKKISRSKGTSRVSYLVD